MWYYQIIHNTTCGILANFSALRERSPNRAFSSIKSGKNGGWSEPTPAKAKPPVGPQKKLKENRSYFGKLNIQKKRELQEYLHKKNEHFPEISGELGIKKQLIKVKFPHEDIFEPSEIRPPKIRSRYHFASARN